MTASANAPLRTTGHPFIRRPGRLAGVVALALTMLSTASPAIASAGDSATAQEAASEAAAGYEWLFDGTEESFENWAYAGAGGFDLQPDGTIRSRGREQGGGFGALWYPAEQYADFSLRLEFRDDAPGDLRGNSGILLRFPSLAAPVDGCPTTFNGRETGNPSWIAVNCGHEVQINDSPEAGTNDPRKTGSIYGFADLDLARAKPTPKGTWNEYEIRVVGQRYTVIRNGVVINEYDNLPGVPFPGRDSSSRGLVGHIGLQAHGGPQDVISFRNVRVLELPPSFELVRSYLDQSEVQGTVCAEALDEVRTHVDRAESLMTVAADDRAVVAQLETAIRESGAAADSGLVTALADLADTFG